jgi:hypothetical protein
MKYLIFNVEYNSYVRRDGSQAETTKIYYIDPLANAASSTERGFTPVSKDVHPDFALADFPEVPGYYDLNFRPSRGRRNTYGQYPLVPKLTDVEFIDKVDLPTQDGACLLLGIRRYEVVSEGRSNRGVKFFALDPESYLDTPIARGYALLEGTLDRFTLDRFSVVPGYYNIEYSLARGAAGDSLYKPQDIQYVADCSLFSESVTTSTTSTYDKYSYNS